jgi:hypothetical protein
MTRIWLGGLGRDVAIVALVWVVLYLASRGMLAVGGATSLFFTSLGGVMLAVSAVYLAIVPVQFGWSTAQQSWLLSFDIFDELSLGLVTGLLTGLIASALTVLVYKVAPRATTASAP